MAVSLGTTFRMNYLLPCVLISSLTFVFVRADPSLFSSSTCTSHPTRSYKRHGSPSTDSSITFTVKDSAGNAVSTLCTGTKYTVTASYPQYREALLTASQGSIGGSGSCPNKRVYDGDGLSHSAALTLACGLTGSVTLMVTSATGERNPFLQNSATFPLNETCGCSSGNSTDTATGGDATDTTSDGASTGSGTCGASSLGYACALTVGKGVVLHWTSGGALPPNNTCTYTNFNSNTTSNTTTSGTSLVHLALTSTQSGYASLAFAEKAGTMSPSDSIFGYLEGGLAKLRYYTTAGHDLGSSMDGSWVLHAGVVAPSSGGTTLCFSVAAANAGTGTNSSSGGGSAGRRRGRALQQNYDLDATALQLNWAVSDSNALDGHTDYGGLALNAISGSASVKINEGRNRAAIAHGALMIIAWVLLLPAGVLAARHRWLQSPPPAQQVAVVVATHGSPAAGGAAPAKPPPRARWYVFHMGCQIVGLALFVISIIISVVKLEVEDKEGAAFAHEVIGFTVAGLALIQFVVAWIRPAPGAPRRPLWNFLHHYTGRTAALLAWAAVGLGIYLAHEKYDQSLAGWLVPTIILVASLVITDIILSWRRAVHAVQTPSQPSGQAAVAAAPAAAVNASQPAPVARGVEMQGTGGAGYGYAYKGGNGYGNGYGNGDGGYGYKAAR